MENAAESSEALKDRLQQLEQSAEAVLSVGTGLDARGWSVAVVVVVVAVVGVFAWPAWDGYEGAH